MYMLLSHWSFSLYVTFYGTASIIDQVTRGNVLLTFCNLPFVCFKVELPRVGLSADNAPGPLVITYFRALKLL